MILVWDFLTRGLKLTNWDEQDLSSDFPCGQSIQEASNGGEDDDGIDPRDGLGWGFDDWGSCEFDNDWFGLLFTSMVMDNKLGMERGLRAWIRLQWLKGFTSIGMQWILSSYKYLKHQCFEEETPSISLIHDRAKIILYCISPYTTWQDVRIDLAQNLSGRTTTPKVVAKVLFKALMAEVGALKYEKGMLRYSRATVEPHWFLILHQSWLFYLLYYLCRQ